MSAKDISTTPAWQALEKHFAEVANDQLNDLFDQDPKRFERFSIRTSGLLLDYSKNRITEKTLNLLCKLATQADLKSHINALATGELVNFTEARAALHMACRFTHKNALPLKDKSIVTRLEKNLAMMQRINDAIKSKQWLGFSGKPITDVVNIGIGGSDLGPKMVVTALTPYHENIRCHFLSNVDATDFIETVKPLTPATTLFIISSKSFNTIETKINADSAKKWLLNAGAASNKLNQHFIAITAAPDKAIDFGIDKHNILSMPDEIGGRYSLWSAIGLPIVIALGMGHFKELLAGAHDMDQHFQTAEFHQNMPVIMALLGIWYINFFNCNNYAVIAYDEYFKYFKNHIQQLDMESNGKHVNLQGHPVTYNTGPVIWGELGCNGQHAFHQLLHQGTQMVPVDFIVPVNSHNPHGQHHDILVANAMSQAQALMLGKTVAKAHDQCITQGLTEEEAKRLAVHKSLLGNRPSNTLMIDKVTPRYLGALIALYEHKVFTQSVIWQINPFDQWGVELGKTLATSLLPSLTNKAPLNNMDCSTRGLIQHYLKHKT